MTHYKIVEYKEGIQVRYLAVRALKWNWQWGHPTVGFVEIEDDEARRHVTKLEAENARLRARLEQARIAYARLMDYRQRNSMNFQLEKMDDNLYYLRELGAALEPEQGITGE